VRLGRDVHPVLLALRHARASRVALIAYATPVIAVATGVVFLDEPLTLRFMLGGALVILGVAFTCEVASLRIFGPRHDRLIVFAADEAQLRSRAPRFARAGLAVGRGDSGTPRPSPRCSRGAERAIPAPRRCARGIVA
jgi:hypothetical protein